MKIKEKILALVELDRMDEGLKKQIIDWSFCLYRVDEERISSFAKAIDEIHDEDEY